MKLKKAFKLSFKNITRNKLRNSFVILAFILAVILGSIIIGPVIGFKNYWVNSINDAGFNVIMVIPGRAEIGGFYSLPSKWFTLSDVYDLQKIEGIAALSPVFIAGYFKFGKNDSALVGVWDEVKIIGQLNLYKGRFLNDNDENSDELISVLGYNVWNIFLQGLVDIDQNLTLTLHILRGTELETMTIKLKVVGLLNERPRIPGSNINPNNLIYIPLKKALEIYGIENLNKAIIKDGIFISANSFEIIDEVSEKIKQYFILKGYIEGEDFTVLSQKDALVYIEKTFDQFNNFITIIWVAVITISSLSILIVMVISVRERFKEIGTLRALGAKRKDILLLFIFESMVLSLIGIIIGSITGITIIEILKQYFEFIKVVNLEILLNAYLIILPEVFLAAILFSLYPAYKASKIEPAVALRYE